MDEVQRSRSQSVKVMKVKAWYVHVNYLWDTDLDTERDSIQMSDDGDHVGTVQNSLTESSCVEVSNLPFKCKQAFVKPLSTHSVMGFKASWMLPICRKYRRISHMTNRRLPSDSLTLMAASRASALVIDCEGRDNIGRSERELT